MRPRSAAADVLVGGSQVLAALAGAPVLRGRYNRWGVTAAEAAAPMPGDELVAEPQLLSTRGIAVDAAPTRVWPWLAQVGWGRGGLYSFDGLENLVGCDLHSVERILPEHQDLHVGDLIQMGPPGYPCFRVQQVEPPHVLVLVGADPRPPHGIPGPDSGQGVATWQWQLRATRDGRATRLLVRQRLSYPRSQSVLWHVVEPVAFVMERQMLRGLARRAGGG